MCIINDVILTHYSDVGDGIGVAYHDSVIQLVLSLLWCTLKMILQ